MTPAHIYYKHLQTLAHKYPRNEDIVLRQAKGACNLITSYSMQGNTETAQAYYKDIQTLTQAYFHNDDVVIHQAVAAGSQLFFASEEDKRKHKTYFLSLLKDLEILLSEYEDEQWQNAFPELAGVRKYNQWLKS